MSEKPANNEVCEELIKALRIQRHDFINHIQVIHAFVQLGKTEKALKYIEELAKNPRMISDVLSQSTCPAECERRVRD